MFSDNIFGSNATTHLFHSLQTKANQKLNQLLPQQEPIVNELADPPQPRPVAEAVAPEPPPNQPFLFDLQGYLANAMGNLLPQNQSSS